tara:strand:+ start:6842 stop:6982 length:141 start_codon:yes stop_codon:yes gene_type:complete
MRKLIDQLIKSINAAKLAGKPKAFIQKLQQQLDKIIANEPKNKRTD